MAKWNHSNMATGWTKIDKVLYQNRHRELSTKEIAEKSKQSIGNVHSKMAIMFKFGEVSRKKQSIYGSNPPHHKIMWRVKPNSFPRIKKRMEKLDE